jgi:hypothetical protein
MEVAAFVIGCVAFVLSVVSLGWQMFVWRHAHKFNVRVRISSELIEPGSGKLDATVMVENLGRTDEAVQTISLLYHASQGGVGSVTWDRDLSLELPPRRNVRKTYDLLAPRFMSLPITVTAHVMLETGKTVQSEPFSVDDTSLAIAQTGTT